MSVYDLLVIGAGPAGMTAAGTAAEAGLKVCLLEKGPRAGRKLAITGKGRCNVTNCCEVQDFISSVPTNGRFLFSAAAAFPPRDVMAFFESLGVPLKTERGNRVFPCSDHAQDIVDALLRHVRNNGAELRDGDAQTLLIEDGTVRGAVLRDGEKVLAEQTLIACGGSSYPGTGSNGDGFRLAKQAGHSVMEPRPSLVPLTTAGKDCRDMMGLSLRNVGIRVEDRKKGGEIYRDFGEMLFTHFGVSGPVILSASAHMRQMEPGRYQLYIDLKPALSKEQLDNRLQRDFVQNQNRIFMNALGALLPRKLIPVAVRRSGIPGDTPCNRITREQRHAFGDLLKGFSLAITGFRPIEEAIVTSGGVAVRELNPRTMESKLAGGLYFAGEVIDVDAYTGGFNLQIAFCTARLAALAAAKRAGYDG